MSIQGKALLVIEREDDYGHRKNYRTWPFIQTCRGGGEFRSVSAHEDLQLLDGSTFPLPDGIGPLEIGDRVRVWVRYRIDYYTSWEGEWDFDLTIEKVRVLKRQPFNPKRQPYWSKAECQRRGISHPAWPKKKS